MLRNRLHIPGGDDTDKSGEYTVEKVFCLGCCTLAPVVRCGESVYGPQTTDGIADLIRRIQGLEENGHATFEPRQANSGPPRGQVNICLDSCCLARGCDRVYRSLQQSLLASGDAVRIKRVACGLMCEQAPTIGIELPGAPRPRSTRTSPRAPRGACCAALSPATACRAAGAVAGAHELDRFLDDTPPIPPQTRVASAPTGGYGRVLRAAGPHRHRAFRQQRPAGSRRVHGPGRLHRAGAMPEDDAARGRGGGGPPKRSAGTRRRRLSHGREMGHRAAVLRQNQVRDLQRRRRRSGRVHGPHAHGIVSLSDHRGHVHRGLRDGRRQGHRLRAGGVSVRGAADAPGRWTASAAATCSAAWQGTVPIFVSAKMGLSPSAPRSPTSNSRSSRVPGLSCAARRPRFWNRSKAAAAFPACGRLTRPSAACSATPR